MTKVIVAAWQRRCLLAFVGVVVVVLCTTRLIPSAYGQASADPSTGISSTSDDPYPKVFGILRQLLQGDPRDTGPLRSLLAPSFGLVRGGLIGVSIQTADTGLTLGALAGIGRAASNVRGTAIELYASASDVLALANRPEIWRVEAIVPPQATVVSQGRTVHNASTWIAGGVTGSGIKVGIIDVGFQNIQNLLGSELPASVTARCYTALGLHLPLLLLCGGSDHGTAVAESLFDVAPGVQLYISQPSSKLDFANTVDWMISEGVTIISHSAVWTWDGPGDGTSPYSDSPLRSVDAAVAHGATFVTSAGNAGLATWSGAWRDIDGDNTHEFSSTLASESNGISLMSGQRVEMHMRWQDSWTAAASDLDIMLVDRNGVVRAQATSRQAGRAGNTPSEYFSTIAPGTDTYFIKVVRVAGPAPAWLQVQSFSFIPLQYTTPGSIGNPGESRSPGMLTVGAASWQTPTVIEPFSSVGPTPDGRPKPDIVGADQASTVTYPSFGGTSQAAPHVAGLAALVKSAFPSYTPQQVASFLTSNAQPRGTGRPNSTWGWGFARLPSVCGTTAAPASASFGQGGGSAQFAVTAVRTCSWTASSQVPWATLTSGSSTVGNASVTVNVAPNTGVPRSGTLLLGSASVTITQAGPVAPTTNPRSLTVAVSGDVATLTWLPPDAGTPSGYALEIGTQPSAADLATLQAGSSTYFSFEATPGLYYARVRANVGGTVTPPSNEVSFRIGSAPANPNPVSPPPPPPPSPGPPPPPAPGPPSAPLNLGATTAGGNVSLTWGPPASAVGLLGYQLQAGSAPGRSDLATIIVMAPSLYVPGVGPGVYHVRVRAGNALGIGPPSNEVTVVVPRAQPPGAPTGLTHIVSGSTVTLHWQPPASGGAVSSYYLVAGSQSGLSNLARISIGPLTALAVPNVPRGVYYVRVVATNAVGSSALSSNEVVVVVGGG